jgi:hypothetical protein
MAYRLQLWVMFAFLFFAPLVSSGRFDTDDKSQTHFGQFCLSANGCPAGFRTLTPESLRQSKSLRVLVTSIEQPSSLKVSSFTGKRISFASVGVSHHLSIDVDVESLPDTELEFTSIAQVSFHAAHFGQVHLKSLSLMRSAIVSPDITITAESLRTDNASGCGGVRVTGRMSISGLTPPVFVSGDGVRVNGFHFWPAVLALEPARDSDVVIEFAGPSSDAITVRVDLKERVRVVRILSVGDVRPVVLSGAVDEIGAWDVGDRVPLKYCCCEKMMDFSPGAAMSICRDLDEVSPDADPVSSTPTAIRSISASADPTPTATVGRSPSVTMTRRATVSVSPLPATPPPPTRSPSATRSRSPSPSRSVQAGAVTRFCQTYSDGCDSTCPEGSYEFCGTAAEISHQIASTSKNERFEIWGAGSDSSSYTLSDLDGATIDFTSASSSYTFNFLITASSTSLDISLGFTRCRGYFAAQSQTFAVTIASLSLRSATLSSNGVGMSSVRHLTTDGVSTCSFTVSGQIVFPEYQSGD